MKRLLLLLLATLGLAVPLAPAPSAMAGTYVMSVDTSSNIDGWKATTPATGYWACSFAIRPGPCADADVAMPTPLRLFAKGPVKTDEEAFWFWVAPATVSIASGSVTVNYATGSDYRAFMKARLRTFAFASQPRLHVASDSGTASWSIPGGSEAVGLFLTSVADHSPTNKWTSNLSVLSMTATLRDDTAPTASLSGDLASHRWLNDTQPVCVTVSAADAGSGVVTSELRDQVASVYDSHLLPTQPVMQPGVATYSHDLCLTPSQFADGNHDLLVRVKDAAGESVDVPFTIHTDSHAPVAQQTTPAETTLRRPAVSFAVDAGPSGLAQFDASVDGQPMTITGATATYQPAADLSFGTHTVTWTATDTAGNHRDGFWSFQVVDPSPPVLSDRTPAAGSSSELRRPVLGFTLSDDGSGIDPSTLRVLLDGTDVAAFGTLSGDRFTYQPAGELAFGRHTVSVAVSDRFGNAMAPESWGFDVADATPPVLNDVRPDDGSSSSDRTPEISVAISDAGTGVDGTAVVLVLDGTDVTSRASFAGGRLKYVPSAPMGYGHHSVTARAGDRAGNAATPLTWSFEVRDETPPVISNRTPRPGATVVGPAAVTFDVADPGTGVDEDSLEVTVDGSPVGAWSTFTNGHFVYDPGTLAAGVHTVAVTVADTSGNVAGPVMWQFAVSDPARIDLVVAGGAGRIVAGDSTTLRYRATSNGAPLAGATLRLTSRPGGAASFGNARTLVTDAAGEASVVVSPQFTTDYRLEMVDSGTVSVARTVVVAQRVGLTAARSTQRRGSTIHLSGRVLPTHGGIALRVQLFTRHGWTTVARPLLSSRGTYSATLLPRVTGRYVFRVLAPPTPDNAAGASRSVTVRIV
ncbi:MAG TPA: hypothetical protein VE824_07560 [Gaiellales bacterium]|nr:hypothetical protein [Gaiellales bacterium]